MSSHSDPGGYVGAAPRGLSTLRRILEEAAPRLRAIPSDVAGQRPAPGKWSRREELGHLVDSASNNHQRLVRTQLEDRPAMPGYGADAWVALHDYQAREWPEIIDLWLRLNEQLLSAGRAAPEGAWSRMLTVGGGDPMTLAFLIDDYVRHMTHHLRHIGVEVGS
jgi:DinB family protein